MKIVFSNQNNNCVKPQNKKVNFEAGLTPKMMQEIQHADVLDISKKLEAKSIPNDFNGNNGIAWYCNKTVEIFKQFNEHFGINLSFPRGIFAIDFKYLKTDTPHAYGLCNLTPTTLIKGSNEIIPSRVVFFNTEHNWNAVDSISNARYAKRQSGTDFFLDIFFHEFSHVLHEDWLLELFDGETLLKMLELIKEPKQILAYQKKYGTQVSRICHYALTDPLEAVACDLSKRMAKSIDKETLVPIRNPLASVPYKEGDLSLYQKLQIKINPLNGILRNFRNGEFD